MIADSTPNIKKGGLFILFAVIVLGGYQIFVRNEINKDGVYSKCTIINSEGYKDGVMTMVAYGYKDNNYRARVRSNWKKEVGDEYFIKILPNDPEAIIFLEDNPVPACLLKVEAPSAGWRKLPNCE
jgi:hypothetical protein